VVCEKPVPESWNTLRRGVIRISSTVFPHTTKPPSSAAFILEDAAGRIIEEVFAVAADDRASFAKWQATLHRSQPLGCS